MAWSVVNFGKYAGKGKTLPQVVFDDPDWFFWALKAGAFRGPLERESQIVANRATKIKIPKKDGTHKVRYYVTPTVDKLGNIEVVEADRSPHVGASTAFDRPYFDLSIARQIAKYDKTGGKFVVQSVKYHVFGSKNIRLTKDKCESFFGDPSNFG